MALPGRTQDLQRTTGLLERHLEARQAIQAVSDDTYYRKLYSALICHMVI